MDIFKIEKAADLPVGTFVIVGDCLAQVVKQSGYRTTLSQPLACLSSGDAFRVGITPKGGAADQYIDCDTSMVGWRGAYNFVPLSCTTKEAALRRFERISREVVDQYRKHISQLQAQIEETQHTAQSLVFYNATSCVGGDP